MELFNFHEKDDHPCFDGAFLAQLAAGASPFAAARYACAAAALSTQGFGAVDPVPSADEVRRFQQRA